jgi:hypothetical protein
LTSPLTLEGAYRLVSLGSLAVRPVAYLGAGASGPFEPPVGPIEGLTLRSTSDRRAPVLHVATDCYGFVDLVPGAHRVHLSDARGRFLPRAITAVVPDRRPLGAAIARGAAVLPSVPAPPLVRAWLRPAPGQAVLGTALLGTVRSATGEALPFAWIRVEAAQGRFVTYSDARGEYLAPLAFLRPVVAPGDDVGSPIVPAQVSAYPRSAPPSPADRDEITSFPADFDDLVPGTASFVAVYGAAVFDASVDIIVGITARLDLQPA